LAVACVERRENGTLKAVPLPKMIAEKIAAAAPERLAEVGAGRAAAAPRAPGSNGADPADAHPAPLHSHD
jgi:hypothetical protein